MWPPLADLARAMRFSSFDALVQRRFCTVGTVQFCENQWSPLADRARAIRFAFFDALVEPRSVLSAPYSFARTVGHFRAREGLCRSR